MSDLIDRLKAAFSDRYALEREVGRGGMAAVYLAEDLKHGRKVAIKILHPELSATLGPERFLREIGIAARLTHPHILPLLDSGEAGGFVYYVMPYIEGQSLRARLTREHELPVGDVVRILRDVVDALVEAHTNGVVHRDIKPDNVMIRGQHALVTDFGVAKAVSEASGRAALTTAGVALGTPTYMAPEQASADPAADHRVDIYAVGVMAYEMLSGRVPFAGPNAQSILASHVTEIPVHVTTHRTTVPPGLAAVVMTCLEKKPADRWQSASDLLAQLEQLVTPSGGITPTGTQPAISAVDHAAIARAHPVRVGAVFTLAAVGVLSLVYFLVQLIGLPDWVFYGAIALMAAGLPVMLLTGHHERKRELAKTSGRMNALPAGGIQQLFTWRKALVGGGVAFAGLGILSAGFMTLRALGIGPAGTLLSSGKLSARDRLLVSDFVNVTPDSTVGESVTELLRVSLAQSRAVGLMEPGQVDEVLVRMNRSRDAEVTSELAREIATREGLKAFVAGEVRAVGTGFVVSAHVVATATGEALVSEKETATTSGELIGAVDRLSDRLRERIGESLRSVRADPPLDQLTTTSLEALRLYAQATEVSSRNDYRRAVALLKEALARDSMFAMAWRRMGAFMASQAQLIEMREEGIAAIRRAFTLRDRVAERERYQIDAIYWNLVENDLERSITSYLALLEKYPDDVVALNNVALAYGTLGRFVERDEAYRRAIATGQATATTYSNLLATLRTRGLLASADTVLDLYATRFPENSQIPQTRAAQAGDRGQYDEVLKIAAEAGPKYPTLDVWALGQRAQIALLHGRLAEADRLAEQSIQTDAPRTNVSPAERDFRIELGRVNRHMALSENRTSFAPKVEELWQRNRRFVANLAPLNRRYQQFIGLFWLAGKPQRARQLFDELNGLLDQRTRDLRGNRLTSRRAEAGIMVGEGRFQDAIEILSDVREENRECGFCDLVQMADTYDRAGNADSSIAYYERYLETPGVRFGTDATWLASSLNRLGELHEARGNRAKAAEYYGRFADLWKNADAELQPAVRDARARMVRLTGEP